MNLARENIMFRFIAVQSAFFHAILRYDRSQITLASIFAMELVRLYYAPTM